MFTPKGGSEGLLPGHGGECPVSGLMPMSWSDPVQTFAWAAAADDRPHVTGRRPQLPFKNPQPRLADFFIGCRSNMGKP